MGEVNYVFSASKTIELFDGLKKWWFTGDFVYQYSFDDTYYLDYKCSDHTDYG